MLSVVFSLCSLNKGLFNWPTLIILYNSLLSPINCYVVPAFLGGNEQKKNQSDFLEDTKKFFLARECTSLDFRPVFR